MNPSSTRRVTQMLAGMRGESRQAAMERLLPLVYDELRALARAQLRHERPDHTLQATALVHEAYLRLLGGTQPPWNDRQHFLRAAAEAMRRNSSNTLGSGAGSSGGASECASS